MSERSDLENALLAIEGCARIVVHEAVSAPEDAAVPVSMAIALGVLNKRIEALDSLRSAIRARHKLEAGAS